MDDRLMFAVASCVAAGLAEGDHELERARGSLSTIGAMLAHAAPDDDELQGMLAGRIPYDTIPNEAPGGPSEVARATS